MISDQQDKPRKVQQKKPASRLEDHLHQTINQSADGVHFINKNYPSDETQLHVNKFLKTYKLFLRSLNNLISYQNSSQTSEICHYPIIMPYHSSFIYVHLKNAPNFSKANSLNSRLYNYTVDNKMTSLQQTLQKPTSLIMHDLYNQKSFYDQLAAGNQSSQFLSPFASCFPLYNSQSFDPAFRKNIAVNNSLDRILGNNVGLIQNIADNQPKKLEKIQNANHKQKKEKESESKWLSFSKKEIEKKIEPEPINKVELPDNVSESWELNEMKLQKVRRRRQGNGFKKKDESDSFYIEKRNDKHCKKVNDTKNITKNYSKAIITYIISCKEIDADKIEELQQQLKKKKNTMTNIKQLRDLWTDRVEDQKQKEFNRVFRIIRQFFNFLLVEVKYF